MKPKWFWTILIALILFFFKNAFSIGFFKDDLYFLNLSQISSLSEFFGFFNPLSVRGGGFRPVSTQLFYFLINFLNLSHFQIHLIMFLVYILGLVFLFKSLLAITKNRNFAMITVWLYALSFIHVFQLYTACTFQEICLFTFLNLSFYYLLQKREKLSFLFFVLALASKEYAIFYPVLIWVIFLGQNKIKNFSNIQISKLYLIIITLSALILSLMLKYQLSDFAQNPLYTIRLEPRLIINNLMWLFLWAIGFPYFMPDYLPSIFAKPLPDFYQALSTFEAKFYFYPMLAYLFILGIVFIYLFFSQKKQRLTWLILGLFSFGFFVIFNLPTLPTIHKTMIRLNLPLLFLLLFPATILTKLYQLKKLGKILAIVLIMLYTFWNYYGTLVHESASTNLLESNIYFKAKAYFEKNRSIIIKKNIIYIDDQSILNSWGGSKKLKDTFWGQNFVQYIFPEKKLKMVYGFEQPNIPKNAYVVSSSELLPY